jgi:alcohol dehydrogenase (cytochrome c)
MFLGGYSKETDPIEGVSAVRALDPLTGARQWEYPLTPRSISGLLSTAGDLVFGGSVDGYFFALDASTGELLWRMSVGGAVVAAPITFLAGGRQYVTIAAGSSIFTFGLD